MDPNAVLSKTPLGMEALSQRDHGLSRTLRHALIFVDGRSTVAQLEEKGSVIPEFRTALIELLANGLVAVRGKSAPIVAMGNTAATGPIDQSQLEALKAMALSVLGKQSAKVVKKLEEAGASREALLTAIDSSYKLIRLTIDESEAEDFRNAAWKIIAHVV
ncbi:MAG: hypothetical protein IPP88_20515 [Betaproteobacteria bacterium]|nr:hypothetical protein [Betaproteobacteria bacterium]